MSDWLSDPDRPEARKARRRDEYLLQRAVIAYLRLALPRDALAFSVPNEGYRSRKAGGELVATGLTRGVPDLVIVWRGRALFLELKSRQGSLSKAQKDVHRLLVLCGAEVMLCRSVNEVEAALREVGVPLRASVL